MKNTIVDCNLLLQNGIDSIQLGIEDLHNAENATKRLISSLRNITAGILLLLKAKLCQLDPSPNKNILIASSIDFKLSNNKFQLEAKGKTIDWKDIKNRFKNCNLPLNEDIITKIQKIIDERNNIEHFYTKNGIFGIKSLYGDLLEILNYISEELLNSNTRQLFTNKIIDIIISDRDIYQNMVKANLKKWEELIKKNSQLKIIKHDITCPYCHTSLVYPENYNDSNFNDLCNIIYKCQNCNEEISFDEIIDNIYDYANYSNIKDGGEAVTDTCPHCGKDHFIIDAGVCLSCGERLDYEKCIFCERQLTPGEQLLDGYCGDCYHRLMKDD